MVILAAGPLDKRIRIEFKTDPPAVDDNGEEIIAWNLERTVWAEVKPIRGSEFLSAGQTQSEISHRIRCRFFSGMTPRKRIVLGTRAFDVVSAINVEEKDDYLEIMAKERL